MAATKLSVKARRLKEAQEAEAFLEVKQNEWLKLWVLALEVEVTRLTNQEFVQDENWYFEDGRFSVNCKEKKFSVGGDDYSVDTITLAKYHEAEYELRRGLELHEEWLEKKEKMRRVAQRAIELRMSALSKLSTEEKKALGLNFP